MRSPASLIAGLLSLVPATVSAQDTVRVRADGPPTWGPNVGLIQELSIGQIDGPPEYAFGRIFFAAAQSDGAFYLYDANDRQIRRYDAQGRFTGRIGRSGGGPGEYMGVGGMAVDRDNRLVIFDPGTSRISWFLADGTLQREQTIVRGTFDPFYIDSAGRMYLIVTAGGRVMEGPGAKNQFLRLRQDGSVLDSIPFPQIVESASVMQTFALSTSDGMRHNFTTANVVAPYLAGGLLAAETNEYRVFVNDGRKVLAIERPYRAVQLGSEERAQWLALAASLWRRPGPSQYEIPRVKPPLRALRSDHLGRIWVEVWVAAEKRNEPPIRPDGRKQILFWKERTTFDVFAPTGQYLGRVVLPAESILLAIRGNRLYTRARGSDGEDRVVVYRLALPDGS